MDLENEVKELKSQIAKLESNVNMQNQRISQLVPQVKAGKITNGTMNCSKINLINHK